MATACRSIEPLCPGRACETLATVVESMKGRRRLHRDYCEDAAGTNYTTLRAFDLPGLIWLFRADSGELVSSYAPDGGLIRGSVPAVYTGAPGVDAGAR